MSVNLGLPQYGIYLTSGARGGVGLLRMRIMVNRILAAKFRMLLSAGCNMLHAELYNSCTTVMR